MSLIIVRCDVGLFKIKCFFQFKFTFSYVNVILPNYWLYVLFFFFSLFIFLFHAVFVLRLWAMYAECLNKYMFCSVLFIMQTLLICRLEWVWVSSLLTSCVFKISQVCFPNLSRFFLLEMFINVDVISQTLLLLDLLNKVPIYYRFESQRSHGVNKTLLSSRNFSKHVQDDTLINDFKCRIRHCHTYNYQSWM